VDSRLSQWLEVQSFHESEILMPSPNRMR